MGASTLGIAILCCNLDVRSQQGLDLVDVYLRRGNVNLGVGIQFSSVQICADCLNKQSETVSNGMK